MVRCGRAERARGARACQTTRRARPHALLTCTELSLASPKFRAPTIHFRYTFGSLVAGQGVGIWALGAPGGVWASQWGAWAQFGAACAGQSADTSTLTPEDEQILPRRYTF